MKNGQCPKCESQKIIPAASVGQVVPTGPMGPMGADSTLFIKYSDVWNRKSVAAYVCGDCGYTELYVEKPQGMWDNYNKSSKTKNN